METKPVSRSSSAALAAARAMSADPATGANGNANEPSFPALADSAAVASSPLPLPEPFAPSEIISPLKGSPVPPVPSDVAAIGITDDNRASTNNASVISLGEEAAESPSEGAPHIDMYATDHPDASPSIAMDADPAAHFEDGLPPSREDLLLAAAEPNAKIEISKTDEKPGGGKSIAPRTALPSVEKSRPAVPAEKWIPPALLEAWKQTNHQQKKLLAHMGAACVGGILALVFILAVTQIHSSAPRPAAAASLQQPVKPPADSGAGNVTSQINTVSVPSAPATQAGPSAPAVAPTAMPAATPAPQRDDSAPSPFANLTSGIFGSKSDAGPAINDHQMGVQVWTIQSSGYYYCAEDPYIKSVQSGSFMPQGDALQGGYRPRLGQFCN
jgi:hypothetical protein